MVLQYISGPETKEEMEKLQKFIGKGKEGVLNQHICFPY